jgi:hypothetical protein
MGIYNRDYMKRPSDDDHERASSPDARLEAFFSGFLQKHPRFFLYLGIGILVLAALALVVVKFSSKAP